MPAALDIDSSIQGTAGAILVRLACTALWMAATVAAAQPTDLESRIAAHQGADRLPLIAEYLATASYDDPQRALELSREGLQHLASVSDQSLKVDLTCGLCRAQVQASRIEEALLSGDQCLQLSQQRGDQAWQAWAHLWCLRSSYLRDGQIGKAVFHEEQAVALYEQLGESAELAFALSLAGRDLAKTGDLSRGLDRQLRAHRLYRDLGDHLGQARALLRAGLVFGHLGQADEALDYAQQSLAEYQAAGSEAGVASAMNNIGVVYRDTGRLHKALEYYEKSLEIKRRLGHREGVARRLRNIGSIYSELGRLDEALDVQQQAYDRFVELADIQEIAICHYEFALLHQRRGDLPSAIAAALQAIEVAESVSYEDRLVAVYRLLADLHEQGGAPTAALAAMRRYDEVKSSFLNETNSRQVAEMKARYQAERQSREIEELKQKQAIQGLEMVRQRDTRTAMVIGFGLLLSVLGLLFNRYRLRARAQLMAEAVDREKAISAGLREIDRLKDDFLANTSHELRTPLFGIVGIAESLLDGVAGELSPAARHNLGLVVASGSRLTRLVDDILDFSSLRRERLELAAEPVELHALADIVVTLSKPLLAGKPVELINAVDSQLPPALADANRVQQILHNLVGNAIKFTESGTVTIDADRQDGQLAIRVHDTGIGIAKEQQVRIFDSFSQADTSIERDYGGTGLGLAISRQLVELHGGQLTVESAAGSGAVFTFTLPSAAEPAAAEPRGEPDDEASVPVLDTGVEAGVPSPDVRDFHVSGDREDVNFPVILIIDDEPIVRQVLSNHLGLRGYRLLSASSGVEALEVLASESVDLVLLDVMMPRMSGYEVCRRIREQHSLEELPVIFLSAKTRASDRVAGFEEGGNDFLSKPIAKKELLARVQTQLKLLTAHRAQAEELKVLSGLLPICAYCKSIRDDDGAWNPLESYIDRHSEAAFSHGVCPDCLRAHLSNLDAV